MAAGLACLVGSWAATAADLVIAVDGIATSRGNIIVRLYERPAGFPKNAASALATRIVPAMAGDVRVTFGPVAATRVAVAVAHDIDGDGMLDFNFLGIPSEPYGFSRNARGSFGPPAFEDAVTEVPDEGRPLRVSLTTD